MTALAPEFRAVVFISPLPQRCCQCSSASKLFQGPTGRLTRANISTPNGLYHLFPDTGLFLQPMQSPDAPIDLICALFTNTHLLAVSGTCEIKQCLSTFRYASMISLFDTKGNTNLVGMTALKSASNSSHPLKGGFLVHFCDLNIF